jgi:hypothetical protein
MKKILAFILIAMLLLATPIVAFAEGDPAEEAETETEKTMTETIADYLKSHIEEISVMGTLVMSMIVGGKSKKSILGTVGTVNNNAIAIAENSASTIKTALEEVADIANIVKGYKDEFAALLYEVRKSADEKESLETTLTHVENFLKTAKLATLELSNEVAELLVLANIPTSKKDELYARHVKAVHDLEVVEEVMSHDGKEE